MEKRNLQIFSYLSIGLVWLLVVRANYTPGTWLTGWDNLHPEFNFSLSLSRSLNAVWQEYQGVGLLGGMGHASDLGRQILLWVASLVLPTSTLRYVWHFSMLLLGPLGVFFLLKNLLYSHSDTTVLLASVVGSLFYLLNLGTVQNFYVPFEPFSTFYGFLPWSLYFLLHFLNQKTRENFLLFTAVGVLLTPIGYVQTVFVVYVLVLAVILAGYIIERKKRGEKVGLLPITLIGGTILAVNAFWLLPSAYFTLTNAEVTVEAKTNQLSTEETFLRNQAFGGLQDVFLLRGFWFDFSDFNESGELEYILKPWREHYQNPWVLSLGYLPFALVIGGVYFSVKSKLRWRYGLVGIFILSLMMLIGENIPTGFVMYLLRVVVPLFRQVFRSPFTKWVVPASLAYSLFLGIGVFWIGEVVKRKNLIVSYLFFTIIAGVVFLLSAPAFKGYFLYPRVKQTIPSAYFSLFQYFQEQNKNNRIANFPQFSFWGWQWHDWSSFSQSGYRGSGFLWYGIEQPILDRAFDPWSQENEQYYWEMRFAFTNQNSEAAARVLQKYGVSWVLLDTTLKNHHSHALVDYQKEKDFLSKVPDLSLEKQFDFLYVYTFNKEKNNSFVSLVSDLPQVSSSFCYAWEDEAFTDFSHYYLDKNSGDYGTTYLFPTLFTNRSQEEMEFQIVESENQVSLTRKLKKTLSSDSVVFPNILEAEEQLPVRLEWEMSNQQSVVLNVSYLLPAVSIGKDIYENHPTQTVTLPSPCSNPALPCLVEVNGKELADSRSASSLFALFYTNAPNAVVIKEKGGEYGGATFDPREISRQFTFSKKTSTDSGEETQVTVTLPKIDLYPFNGNIAFAEDWVKKEVRNCSRESDGRFKREVKEQNGIKNIEYQSQNASSCDYYYVDALPHSSGYLFSLTSRHISGLPLKLAIQNPVSERAEIETYLPVERNLVTSWIIVPPVAQTGRGYTVFLDTVSFGKERSRNSLQKITVQPFPYNFIKQLKSTSSERPFSHIHTQLSVTHPFSWFYQVAVEESVPSKATLTLFQGYNSGWKAVSVSGITPSFPEHVKVSSWANGWLLPPDTRNVLLVFWPQLLEFLGFGMLVGWGLCLSFLLRKFPYSTKYEKLE